METLRKIAELIDQNKTLEQRIDELKNIIIVSLTSANSISDYEETKDFSDTKFLIVKFYQNHKIPTALFDEQGKLVYSIGWRNDNIHHHYELPYLEYLENYINSNEPYYFFQQKNGIHAIALPIEINKRQIATLLLSQFFYCDGKPDEDYISQQALSLDIDKESLISSIHGIPVLNMAEITSIIQNASFLAEMIAFIAHKSAEQKIQHKKSVENNLLFTSLLDKISEQETIIKNLNKDIAIHQQEIKENTVSKSAYQEQQKRLIDKMEKTENILNSLLTSLPLGICFVKRQVITFVNEQMFRILGYTTKELVGRDPEILFVSWNEVRDAFEVSPEKFLYRRSFESQAVKRNGDVLDVIVFLSLIDSDYPGEGLLMSIMDISNIKNTQKELIMAKEKAEESDKLKSAFLDNISHEFRTPMNAILGFTELLGLEKTSENQKREYLKIIQNSGKKLLRLLDDIIDISKLSSNQLVLNKKRFFLKEFLTYLYEDFYGFVLNKHGNAVELILTCPEIDMEIENDDVRLRQILNNLLSNSLKFTSHGSIEFGYSVLGQQIQFHVKDTGKGIKKQQLMYIFDRFRQGDDSFTREHGGAGLGLTLVKGIVELMGGRIWIESKWGKGTTVQFTISNFMAVESKKETLPEALNFPSLNIAADPVK